MNCSIFSGASLHWRASWWSFGPDTIYAETRNTQNRERGTWLNVPEEAMYWRTNVDGAGHPLSGDHDYIVHFPPDGLPPNDAFWSLTMADAKERFVPNPLNRYLLGDRSGLVANADGSVDVYIQVAAPVGHESNWLPAPSGRFRLWLRAYLPGAAALDGRYRVPPVVKSR